MRLCGGHFPPEKRATQQRCYGTTHNHCRIGGDPLNHQPNWNRSFELATDTPVGGVLLLHGMSDSPYTYRALGTALNAHGFWVLGLRLPGHGTAPSGLIDVSWRDMAAAVQLGMAHLAAKAGREPVHIIGYSTGAPLALDFALNALQGDVSPVPASLLLISPAIGLHPAAALAKWKRRLASLPGLGGLAWLQILPEFDPYKYNSFTTNAGEQVHSVTRSVAERMDALPQSDKQGRFPSTLVFKSTVDATVSTDALVDNFFAHLTPDRHELVLFDINRFAVVKSRFLIDDPAPLTDRVMDDNSLPFSVSLVTNENAQTTRVVSKTKKPFSSHPSNSRQLGLSWPPGVISLSHVALAIAPDDPLYGQRAPENDEFIFLGQMAIQGERGLLRIPADWMLRLRYNPFFDYLERRTLEWVENTNDM